jgi:hypothetical protein
MEIRTRCVLLSALLFAINGHAAGVADPCELPADDTAICSHCTAPSPPSCTGVCVEENPRLVVGDDGIATGVLRLVNRGSEVEPLQLRLGDFQGGVVTPAEWLHTERELQALRLEDKSIVDAGKLAPGGRIAVKVIASRLTQPGVMAATLSNGATDLVIVKAVRHRVPFQLKVAGSTPDTLKVSFFNGGRAPIVLTNRDAIAYPFTWRLEIGGRCVKADRGVVMPRSEAPLPVNLDARHYALLETGFLRAGAVDGRLTVQFEPDPSFRRLDVPRHDYDVKADLHYWPDPTMQNLANGATILFLLLCGLVLSMLIRFAIPTDLKKVQLKKTLAALEGRLVGLAAVVSSRTLSLLRAEKRRLKEHISSLYPFFPENAAVLATLQEKVNALTARIDVTARVGSCLKQTTADPTVSPPELERVRAHCRLALSHIDRAVPAPADVQRAEAELALSMAAREAAGQPPTAQMREDVKKQFDELPARFGLDVEGQNPLMAFDSLFNALRREAELPAGSQLIRADYVRATRALRQAQLMRDYVRLVEASGSGVVRAARLARRDDLIEALQPGPGRSLDRASDIVDEVEQGISGAEFAEAVRSGAAALRVEIDPPAPQPLQLVTLRLRSARPGYDGAGARKECRCVWRIDGQPLEDDGFVAYTFFPEPSSDASNVLLRGVAAVKQSIDKLLGRAQPMRPFRVEVSVHCRGNARPLLEMDPVEVTPEVPKSYEKALTLHAGISLFLTVGIVGIGLLAAAQDKIRSMDWLAGVLTVLALGFGADLLKRSFGANGSTEEVKASTAK